VEQSERQWGRAAGGGEHRVQEGGGDKVVRHCGTPQLLDLRGVALPLEEKARTSAHTVGQAQPRHPVHASGGALASNRGRHRAEARAPPLLEKGCAG
jgi:hypothetical protein